MKIKLNGKYFDIIKSLKRRREIEVNINDDINYLLKKLKNSQLFTIEKKIIIRRKYPLKINEKRREISHIFDQP